MGEADEGGRAALRAVAVAAVALAGFLFSLTPVAATLDGMLLDAGWRILRSFDGRPAADDMIIVGIDPATVAAIPEPPALWHRPLARTLARVAAAHPRAIVLDFPLPERSYDAIHPGLDRALFTGLAEAIEGSAFVTVLAIDARTRAAKRIHTPFLALLGESRLGIGMLARDDDGVTRRFSLAIPTEDGAFPTLEGRMCRALSSPCREGLVNYALGAPFAYLPMKSILEGSDAAILERQLRGRIVFIGETQPYSDRVAVPVNLAGWEQAQRDSPAIVVHAQALRTAMMGASPAEASRPLLMLLVTAAALLVLLRSARLAAAWAGVATLAALGTALLALRGGLFIAPAAIVFTLWIGAAFQWVAAARSRRRIPGARSNITHPH